MENIPLVFPFCFYFHTVQWRGCKKNVQKRILELEMRQLEWIETFQGIGRYFAGIATKWSLSQ